MKAFDALVTDFLDRTINRYPLTTSELAVAMWTPELADDVDDLKGGLVRFAERGTPYATRGAEVVRQLWGRRNVRVRPWLWQKPKTGE